MAAWIPDRPLGYADEDYLKMPLSQRICLILYKSYLVLMIGALYAVLIGGTLAVALIMSAITWYAFEGFGIFGGIIAAAVSLYAIASFAASVGILPEKTPRGSSGGSRPAKR